MDSSPDDYDEEKDNSNELELTEEKKRDFVLADEIEISLNRKGKEVYKLSANTKTKIGAYIDRYKKNENIIRFGSITFNYIGRISFWAYKNEPDRVFIGYDKGAIKAYTELSETDMKKLHSMIMKIRNFVGQVGQYAPKAVQKRYNKVKRENEILKKELEKYKDSEKNKKV